MRQLIGVKCRIGNPPLSLMGDLTIARILRPKKVGNRIGQTSKRARKGDKRSYIYQETRAAALTLLERAGERIIGSIARNDIIPVHERDELVRVSLTSNTAYSLSQQQAWE